MVKKFCGQIFDISFFKSSIKGSVLLKSTQNSALILQSQWPEFWGNPRSTWTQDVPSTSLVWSSIPQFHPHMFNGNIKERWDFQSFGVIKIFLVKMLLPNTGYQKVGSTGASFWVQILKTVNRSHGLNSYFLGRMF